MRPRADGAPGEARRAERRFWTTLIVAAVLHAGLAWFVHRELPARRALGPREDLHFFDIALLASSPLEVAPEPSPAEPAPEAAQIEASPARSSGSQPAAAALSAVVPDVSPPVVPSVATPEAADRVSPARPAGSAPQAGLSFDALGIGASNPFVGLRSVSPPGKESSGVAIIDPNEVRNKIHADERRLERSMVTAMLDHDRAAGGSRSGPLATALEEAALLVASPVTGQAEFVATVDATGLVAALRPVRVTSRASDWQHVAAEALRKLAKKRVRVPSGSAGLEVRLLLSSKVQLPSGASAGGAVTLHQVPLTEKGSNTFKLSRLELPPESNQIPNSELPGGTSAGALQQAVPMPGLNGDLADIGGVSRRVVHVSITNERPL